MTETMEHCNGLFTSESLDGLLQQKWRNGVGDSVTPSEYLPNKRKRDDVGQESNGVHNGNTVLRNSLFPEFSRRNSKLDILGLLVWHTCVVSLSLTLIPLGRLHSFCNVNRLMS